MTDGRHFEGSGGRGRDDEDGKQEEEARWSLASFRSDKLENRPDISTYRQTNIKRQGEDAIHGRL